MPPIEDYVKHADTLAQDVINAWGINMQAGNGEYLNREFKSLVNKSSDYRIAKRTAENWRSVGIPTEAVDAEVEVKRRAFVHAYKNYWEKRNPST